MDGDITFEYVVVLATFLAFIYLIFSTPKSKVKSQHPARMTPLGVLQVALIGCMTFGILWFLLWMLTFELIPHGLWGFGMAICALILIAVVDSLTRK